MGAGRAFVGTSGWSYPGWRAGFYAGVPHRRWLAHCARHFTAIEVNATFYRLLKDTTYVRWREETPEGFAFAIKGSRFVTHVRRLVDVGESITLQRDVSAGLGTKLRAVLWQLPASIGKDLARLEGFIGALDAWPGPRHAIEFRHPSWFDDEVADRLADHGIAACQSDAAKWPLWQAVTTDTVYVRLHGHERTYASRYGDKGLGPWAKKARRWLGEGRDVHVYFDNDAEGAAPEDAMRLMEMLGVAPLAAAGEEPPGETACAGGRQ